MTLKTCRFNRRLHIVFIACLSLISLFLHACDESTLVSPEDETEQYTVAAGSAQYLREGPSYNWNQGYDANGLFYWAYTTSGTPYNAVRWSVPFTTAGHYRLEAYIPSVSNQVGSVAYLLTVGGNQRTISVNQSDSSGAWVVLGSFYFDADGSEYIEAGNTSTQTGRSIVFDAMRWTRL